MLTFLQTNHLSIERRRRGGGAGDARCTVSRVCCVCCVLSGSQGNDAEACKKAEEAHVDRES